MDKTRMSGTFNINRVMLTKPGEIGSISLNTREGVARLTTKHGIGNYVPGVIFSFDGTITCPNQTCTHEAPVQVNLCYFSGRTLEIPSYPRTSCTLVEYQEKQASEQTPAGQLLPSMVITRIRETTIKFHPFKGSHITTEFVMGGPSSGFDLPAHASCYQCGTVYADCLDIQTEFTLLLDEYVEVLTEKTIPPLWKEDEDLQVQIDGAWLTPYWIEEIQRQEEYLKKSK